MFTRYEYTVVLKYIKNELFELDATNYNVYCFS